MNRFKKSLVFLLTLLALTLNTIWIMPAQAETLTFTNILTTYGLGSSTGGEVYVSGNTVYVATSGGLSISADGGSTFITKTTANGLGSNQVLGVYASGSTVYAATNFGLSISTDGGNTFSNKTTANGLDRQVFGVYASGNMVYAATRDGLFISTDEGSTFTTKTTADGLGNNMIFEVYASGSTVYVATWNGLSISTDGGSTFTNKTTANGLGNNQVNGVYAIGSTIYAATSGGLSISANGGSTFANKTTTNGLGSNGVLGVYASSGNTVYAATSGGLSISTDGGSTFTNKTTANGLGDYYVCGVYAIGSTIYAATHGGLSISADGGNSFWTYAPSIGLGSNDVQGVYASGSMLYAATDSGLSISTDGGSTFTNKTVANGLGDYYVRGVYASGSMVYAATSNGVSISTDGGSTFTNRTTANGLGSNDVRGVYASGSTVYVATWNGLSISTDGGSTFSNKTTANGLGSNQVSGVYASGSMVYVATWNGGLSISTNGGSTFTNRTTANGLGNNGVIVVYASGSSIYAGTTSGLSISTDGGNTFSNKTTANGLWDNMILGVYASGSTIYAATAVGLAISTDGGNTFSNKTTANGLGDNDVHGVYASGSTVYAATSGGLSISNTAIAVTINQASGQNDPTTLSPINYTAVFSKPINISTFTGSDITLGGTAGATTATITEIAPNDGTTFNIAVSGMTNSGTVTVSLDAAKVTDLDGNPNLASTSTDNTITYNTTTISGNAGVAGATLSYINGTNKTALADGSGYYSFIVPYNWSGTVTPSKTGYAFVPASKSYASVITSQTAQNYTATVITYTISGNAGVAGATLSYMDGIAKTTTADGSGNYSFTVPYNWSGTVTPSKNGYSFSPANRVYANVQADQPTQDYSAVNTNAPAVTISQSSSQIDPSAISPINFTVGFSKPINIATFTDDDMTLGGTAGATTVTISQITPNDGTTFEITVSGMTGSGTVTASLGAGKVTDLSGNPNNASTSSDNSVTYYHELDTVCSNVPAVTPGQDLFGNLVASDDIDPYKFDINQEYTTIVATLTPPASGDFALYLLDSCQSGPVEVVWGHIGRRWLNIGRRWLNIGPGDESIEVRFNVGMETGTYYLAVAVPQDGAYNADPYKLHVELQPPDFGLVDTLILYNPSRFQERYGLEDASQMMDSLTRLASHPKVNGIIIQLDQFPEVTTAYENWDNTAVINGNEHSYSTNVAVANAVSNEIRGAMLEFMQNTGNLVTGYVVVVGDDDQVPFRRLDINPDPIIGDSNWMSEREYFLDLGDIPDTSLDAAMMMDQVLSDDFYGNYRSSAGMGFLPGLAVGRLLDTPTRIQNTIDAFILNNGEITLTPESTAAIAGYDFLADSAQQACTFLHSNGGLVADCSLIDTSTIPNEFTPNDLAQKFIANAPNMAGFYGHTNHGQLFVPDGSVLTAEQISAASFDPASSLWWVIGCQSGLVMPDSENHPLSLAQSLGDHGVTYLGNTGFAGGGEGPLAYSEFFYKLVIERLRLNSTSSVAIGEALRLTKWDYFDHAINNAHGKGKNYIFLNYDYKVMSEATLYGLPMLKFSFPYTAPAQTKVLLQNFVAKEVAPSLSLPSQFHPFPFSLGNLTNSVQYFNGNTYYTNAGKYAFSANTPLLPQSEFFNFDTSLGQAKGMIWRGGTYTVLHDNNPLVIKPIPLNATVGSEPSFNGTYPLLPVALASVEELDGTFTNHLTFQTGQYLGTETNGTLRLFSDMEFMVGLWNGTSSDTVSPELGMVSMTSNSNTVHIELPITDDSGMYKAFVTYTQVDPQATSGIWQSLELTSGSPVCTSGQNTFSLDLPPTTGETDYFIQVMDCAGNVSVKTNDEQYYKVYRNEYTLTVTSAQGTVARNPSKATYTYGETVQLTVTPDAGWSFANWSGDATGTTNPVTVTMNGNQAVTANYTQNQYTLTITSAHGTVARNPSQATYHEGDVVQLTATPNVGWSFANWTGDLTTSDNPDSVTIHGDTAVTANYTQNEYTLTITSAHGIVAKNPNQATYHEGDVVQFTATPITGWSFANWTGDLTSSVNPDAVTIHGNTSVTANYTQNEYTLTITSAYGTVAKNPDQVTYHEGDVVQLTATPTTGWSFANWTGDLTSNANPDSVTIHGNTSVTANYTRNEYTLTITSAYGTVAKNPDQVTYYEGDAVQLTATPTPGWSFANWTGDLISTANPGSITIHGDTSVTANYTQNEYTLTITSLNGTVVANPDQPTYHEGDVVQLTATPDTGWSFANWNGGLVSSVNPSSVTIHGNTSVTANYTQNEYTLSIVSAYGTVVKYPDQTTYHEGDVVQLTATPITGWSFANWTGDLTSSVNPDFVTIHGNTSVTANYTQNEYTLAITSAHGIVAKNPDQATYHEGDVVQLTATPTTGWSFANWTGDLTSSANLDSVTIHGNTTVMAIYTQNEYTLTITSAHGTVTKNPGQATYHEGDVVQLTATPNTGWSFANWTGDLTSSVNPDSVTIHGNTAVTANYTQNEYTLTITSEHGTVAKNLGQATYHEGDVVQLTATPTAGWSFANWMGDLTSSVNPDSVTIHGDTVVTANYTQNEYTLTIISLNGTVSKNPDQSTYHEGDLVQLTATPNVGWIFTNWTGDLISSTNPAFVTIHGNTTVTANYKIITTRTFNSVAVSDGWVIEKGEKLNIGGSLDSTATTFRLGDDNLKKQYRSVLSFNTSGLPDGAVITSVTLKIRQQSVTGRATFNMFQGLLVDIRKGPFGTSALQVTDFQATANTPAAGVGPFTAPAVGGWYTFNLTTGKAYINKLTTLSGLTQFRLRFKLDDNNNAIANYISFFSGNNATNKPTLIIQYYVP